MYNHIKNLKQYLNSYFPLILLLIILTASSLFVSVSLNGGEKGRIYVWSTEVVFIEAIFDGKGTAGLYQVVLVLILLSLHAGVCLLPFFITKRYFFKALVFLPLAFIIFQMAAFILIGFLLIRFFILWILNLAVYKQLNITRANAL